MMENVNFTIEKDTLVIRIDLKAAGRPSASGKTRLVANTGGAQPINHGGMKLSLFLQAPLI